MPDEPAQTDTAPETFGPAAGGPATGEGAYGDRAASHDAAGDPGYEPWDGVPEFPAQSHRGLTQLDPWAEPKAWYQVIWPWGLSGLAETLEVIALALVMFVGVRFVAHNYVVDGGSMLPTFEDGEFVIVNRLAYRSFDFSWVPGMDGRVWQPFGDPQPGDVIVFMYQQQPRERDFIKRVVGVPGQVVEVREGRLYVDGVALDEPYIEAPPNYAYPPTAVPPGQIFVLGDNRNNSFDSHLFGLVDQEVVVGRADIRYWPLGRFWMVDHHLGDAVGAAASRAGEALEGVLVWR
ncbi:MAG: signal peptidase I [Chloroflexi bacterium]|nr:signal peptidase I [Chloroflexota bacterium]MDA1240444.1 signal peptidase I [Chloroflexota bacterium]MQC25731.1 signal peptidase I [Chloroflexota bacterium]MQC48182.1 signal peptidase I [Chloroflexota bacterium]